MIENLLLPSSTAGSVLRRGTITSVRPDSTFGVHIQIGKEVVLITAELVVAAADPVALSRGDEVVCWIDGEEQDRGLILGRIGSAVTVSPGTVDAPMSPASNTEPEHPDAPPVPESIVLEAKQSLTLRVGEGSITIREDGKILIKGKDLVSHAQRMNRIKGGAVSIN